MIVYDSAGKSRPFFQENICPSSETAATCLGHGNAGASCEREDVSAREAQRYSPVLASSTTHLKADT